jgi:hypothetical protein
MSDGGMGNRLQALFAGLSPDKAMCCVSWSVGRVSITTTERFVSVFMSKQAVEDAVVANALSPMHTWARYVSTETGFGKGTRWGDRRVASL